MRHGVHTLETEDMIITRTYALRLLRTGRARNPAALRPNADGRVFVAVDVWYPAYGWRVHHYLQRAI
jgi:hypothetical protein